ncbi:ADP-ribosylation factor-like protein 2-binding protein [Anneissia japonica]|uniref:ADP-ribosylation factor-like protein 2-binding protein n=1 Tax=Anneissia japonica TaxID=1529436 RepID=UPI0014256578|nr:ADP-ribosylation factor-like protein 2-binding protein [Anneissia japonica]
MAYNRFEGQSKPPQIENCFPGPSGEDVESMDFQEEELAKSVSSVSDTKFDITIGHIEDIIMDDAFQLLQRDFMEKHYEEFEDTEENKLIYTEIFNNYVALLNKHIEDELTSRIPDFSMEDFSQQLQKRSKKKQLDGEIFEMLLTFSDFISFKEMFLDYKAEKEGTAIDLTSGMMITPCKFPEPTSSTKTTE